MIFINKTIRDLKEPVKVEVVVCEECGCLLQKDLCFKVKHQLGSFNYCGKCRKPYTRMDVFNMDKPRYFAEVEVDENGKVLKVENK